MTADIKIEWLGGNCPVQSEGTINGQPYYFRARGDSWSMSVGDVSGDLIGDPGWYYEESYGKGPYDAGWMEEDEARVFIETAAERYVSRTTENDGQPDEAQEWADYDRDC